MTMMMILQGRYSVDLPSPMHHLMCDSLSFSVACCWRAWLLLEPIQYFFVFSSCIPVISPRELGRERNPRSEKELLTFFSRFVCRDAESGI